MASRMSMMSLAEPRAAGIVFLRAAGVPARSGRCAASTTTITAPSQRGGNADETLRAAGDPAGVAEREASLGARVRPDSPADRGALLVLLLPVLGLLLLPGHADLLRRAAGAGGAAVLPRDTG